MFHSHIQYIPEYCFMRHTGSLINIVQLAEHHISDRFSPDSVAAELCILLLVEEYQPAVSMVSHRRLLRGVLRVLVTCITNKKPKCFIVKGGLIVILYKVIS